MGRASLLVILLAVAMGCRPHLPVSHADPSPVVDWRDPVANHPARRRVRVLHQRCHEEVQAIRREVTRRWKEDIVYVALATAIANFMGMMGRVGGPGSDPISSSAATQALTGPGGQLSYRCTDTPGDDPSHGGCNPPTLPTIGWNTDGQIRTNRPVDEAWRPAERIEAINASLDALDELLFSRPDPREWTAEEGEAFEDLTDAVETTCED